MINIKMKYKVTFLLDEKNLWFEKQFRNYNFNLSDKYTFKITKNIEDIKNQHIVFPLNYTKKLPESFLNKNELVLILHESKLPKDKGFAPVQYQILKGQNKFYTSLIQATNDIDEGPIYYKNYFKLDGSELSNEIRSIQGSNCLKVMNEFLVKYPKIISKKQSGKSNFNRKRYRDDSELNVNKTIKQHFNHMRINDNEFYPSFFNYKDQKYILKIFKEISKIKKIIPIYLRKAKVEDCKLLLKIHNTNSKQGFFISKNIINFKDHIKWFKNKIKSNSKIYIGKVRSSKKDFGYVRFDRTKNKIYQVSIGNLPNFLGKGLGTMMLDKSIKKFVKADKPSKIICVIKKFNTRSYKCFLSNGFLRIKFDKKKHLVLNKFNTLKEDYFELNIKNKKKTHLE